MRTMFWHVYRRLMKHHRCGKGFAKTCPNRQLPPSKGKRATVVFNIGVPTARKRSVCNLDCTYRAGRGARLNTFGCYKDDEESVLVLSVIRTCLGGDYHQIEAEVGDSPNRVDSTLSASFCSEEADD